MSSFTQRVQPLLLNRCATGACHGGVDAPSFRLHRPAGSAQPDRSHTRVNLAAFLDVVGPARDPRPLAALLAAGHPGGDAPRSRRAAPLSTPERATLDRWLAQVRDAERSAVADPGVVPASAQIAEPTRPRPNRLRALLDNGGPPPDLAPPPPAQTEERFTSRIDLRSDAPPGGVTPPAGPR